MNRKTPNFAHSAFRNDGVIAAILVLFIALSRLIFAIDDGLALTFDDGTFALAARDYSLTDIRPHLPGYYLHVGIIRLLSALVGHPFVAMKYLTLMYSVIAAGMLYFLWRKWFSQKVSLLLTVLIMTNPFVWFYNSITEIYTFSLFFSVGMVLSGASPRGIYFLPVLTALAMGIRPTAGVLLLPLYVFLWIHHYRTGRFSLSRFVAAHLAGMAALLAWVAPMVQSVGGWRDYLNLYTSHNPMEPLSLLQNIYRFSSYGVFLLLPFLVIMPVVIKRCLPANGSPERFSVRKFFARCPVPEDPPARKGQDQSEYPLLPLLFWWVMPALIFFLLFHYSKGYFMLCAAGFLGAFIFVSGVNKTGVRLLVGAIVLQTLVFVFVPYKLPDIRVYMSPSIRDIGIGKVWWERTRSHYLMAQSHIRAVEHFWNAAGAAVESFKKNSLARVGTSPKFLFIDPTFPLKSRVLQARYPEVTFVSMDYYKEDHYYQYYNLDITEQKGLARVMASSLFLSRSDFVEKYLSGYNLQNKVKIGEFTLYTITEVEAVQAAHLYTSLFKR